MAAVVQVDNPEVVTYQRFMKLAEACGEQERRISSLHQKIQELREALEWHIEYGSHESRE